MTALLGIDPSLTNTGLVKYHDDGAHVIQSFTSKPADTFVGRFNRFSKLVNDVALCTDRVTNAIIEHYSYGSKGGLAFDRVEYGALLRFKLFSMGIEVIEVSPMSLKKFITGSGKGEKNQVLLHVFKRWGVECKSDDEADAYGLARIGACLVGWQEPENDAQREVLAVLRGEPKVKKKRKSA